MKAGMKKITYVFLCLLFLCLLITGCGSGRKSAETVKSAKDQIDTDQNSNKKIPSSKEAASTSKKADANEKIDNAKEDDNEDEDDVKVKGSEFTRSELDRERTNIENEKNYNYYYSKLSESDKDLYAQMYIIIREFMIDETLVTLSTDKADAVFMALLADHPALYYITGYSINKYTVGEKVTALKFSGTYTKTEDEISELNEKVREYENRCLANIGDGDDYSKIKYVYEYIINNTEYDMEAPDNQNILSVFVNGKSVCQGYAKATQYLLSKAGIPSILVSGTVKSGESHAWNMVMSDGKWYYLDTTWGDASYSGGYDGITPDICYDYLCTDAENIRHTHKLETKYSLPPAISLDDYYFVREGTYFKWPDLDRLKNLVVDYTNHGHESLVIKCANKKVYEEMLDELISKQRLLDIFYDKENVRYARMDDSYSVYFEL